ncbi:MAG: ankyrin repeat domain-containing protein [Planctomycetota bacterium]|nr:ankyrin repeat domain-containing protein [Planctomycetota bacterium]
MARPDAKPLVDAILKGDHARLAAGIRTAPEAARSWQPIMQASFQGDDRALKLLLKAGADPNIQAKTVFRHRPLHRAAEHKITMPKHAGHDRAVKLLLEAGADPLARGTQHDWTALAVAALGGEPRFVEAMRAKAGPLDVWLAAMLGDVRRVKALLAKDAKLALARDEGGWDALSLAAASRMHLRSPADAAALRAVADALLEKGADPNAVWKFQGKWPLTPLYWAAGWSGNAGVTEALLKAGAKTDDGEALHHAAENLHVPCLELLLKHGCDINHRHETVGNTALHFIVMYTSLRGVPWLLEHGADPNLACTDARENALHAAARRGCNADLLKLLAKHGADPKAKNRKGQTPLDVAVAAKHKNAAAALRALQG